jgi:hypothetical protein
MKNGTIILKYALLEQDMSVWTAFDCLRIRFSSELYEQCNEPSSSVESGKCLEQLREEGFSSMELQYTSLKSHMQFNSTVT